MKISVIGDSYLTPTNKKHIKYLLTKGITEGTINRITYYLSKENSIHIAKIIVPDNSIIFGQPFRIYTVRFTTS